MPIGDYVSRITDKIVSYLFNPKNLGYLMFNIDMNVLEQSCRTDRYSDRNDKNGNKARVAKMKR